MLWRYWRVEGGFKGVQISGFLLFTFFFPSHGDEVLLSVQNGMGLHLDFVRQEADA